MEQSTTKTREELEQRIRSLTSILHKFTLQKSPSGQRKHIAPFLHHFTTLLTCGSKYGKEAKKVVAVAGSVAPNLQARALVVAQNPYLQSPVKSIRLTTVEKDDRPFKEVVMGPSDPDAFTQHICDVLTALSTFDPRATDRIKQKQSLELFFLSRSFLRFEARFQDDSKLCGNKRLFEVIKQWQPDPTLPELGTKWVNPPGWLLEFGRVSTIDSRMFEGQVQWEFSDATKVAWSRLLARFLIKVDVCIEEVNKARTEARTEKAGKKEKEKSREKVDEDEEMQEMKRLTTLSGYLYSLVCWKAGVVKSLLTETSMVSGIATVFMPTSSDETNEELADLNPEPQESKGHQVFRYLRMVTAWHSAVNDLCLNPALPELLNNLEIGLIEVPPSPFSVLSLEEITREFISRFPDMQESGPTVSKVIQDKYQDKFSGCVHAEATLMGLLNYYHPDSTLTSHPLGEEVEDPEMLKQLIQPVAEAGNVTIAVSQKCCWCCDWLGKNLEAEFTLPGTHGIMYPWDPPKVGISVSVLQKLEAELWQELYQAVSSSLVPFYSRHSTPFGSPTMAPEERPGDADLLSWMWEGGI